LGAPELGACAPCMVRDGGLDLDATMVRDDDDIGNPRTGHDGLPLHASRGTAGVDIAWRDGLDCWGRVEDGGTAS